MALRAKRMICNSCLTKIVEQGDDSLLQITAHIDKKIPAADEIEF